MGNVGTNHYADIRTWKPGEFSQRRLWRHRISNGASGANFVGSVVDPGIVVNMLQLRADANRQPWCS